MAANFNIQRAEIVLDWTTIWPSPSDGHNFFCLANEKGTRTVSLLLVMQAC
jgi:hypothetical protein